MRLIVKGATSQTVYFSVNDSASTTGGKKTGIAFNAASLVASYTRNGAARTAITLATQTASGAWSSGGWVEVDATNEPGLYRFDVPDAAFASGVDSVVIQVRGASGMVDAVEEVQLTAVNLQDSVRAGLTALPNAAAEAAGGVYTRGSGAGQINQPANGRIDANVVAIGGTTQTARDLGASVLLSAGTGTGQLDFTSGVVKSNLAQILGTALTETAGQIAAAFKQFFNIATPTSTMNTITTVTTATNLTTNNDKTGYALSAGGVTAVQSGLATSAAQTTLQADTDDIQTRLPAALVSGRMDSSVGAMATGVVTATAIAADAIGASELAADAVAEIAAGVVDLAIAGHTTAGTVGEKINSAAASGNPWDVNVSGHTTSGTFGAKVNSLSGAAGSGAITHVITVTSNGNPVDGALVWVTTDAAGTNIAASGYTDALGHVTVFLDAGTYYQWAQRGGVNFTNGAAVVVS